MRRWKTKKYKTGEQKAKKKKKKVVDKTEEGEAG